MSAGPETVADHLVMSVEDGKAERPGVGDVMRVMSSDWSLYEESVSRQTAIKQSVYYNSSVPFDDIAITRRASQSVAALSLTDGWCGGHGRSHAVQSVGHLVCGWCM